MLPYGRQWIDDQDVEAVTSVLRSDWLTTGPKVGQFEKAFANTVGAAEAVAVSSGTAALHAAVYAIGIQAGDEVIVPAMTFAATANAVVYQGGTPIFADVDPGTLLLTAAEVEKKITPRTRAVIAVDYAGQPCNYQALSSLCRDRNLKLISDASHSLGASYQRRKVGTLADLTTFSFHPVKHIATGEGGMVTTENADWARKMRAFRNHGITTDHRERESKGSFYYEMIDLGFNYRLSDIHCALGLSQLSRLEGWVTKRREIAKAYDAAFQGVREVTPLDKVSEVEHAYHLYVVRVAGDRGRRFALLRDWGIGVNVHYIPVHLHPYYKNKFGTRAGQCPVAEAAYQEILSIPIFPAMAPEDVSLVTEAMLRPEKAAA